MKQEWFASWFDSPYYHILYQNHNETEARKFIDKLLQHLALSESAKVLDLACGKGRHSRYLAMNTLDVVGIDLSEESIKYAQQFETDNLTFYQHDMRKMFRTNYFDAIFNFFTSFGYFDNDNENLQTLQSIVKGLKKDGIFVLDYFNANYVRNTMIAEYTQLVSSIEFRIKKRIEGGYIYKNIAFEVPDKAGNIQELVFEEKVRLFELADFQYLFEAAGLHITGYYGSYDLENFDENNSKRLILKAIRQ